MINIDVIDNPTSRKDLCNTGPSTSKERKRKMMKYIMLTVSFVCVLSFKGMAQIVLPISPFLPPIFPDPQPIPGDKYWESSANNTAIKTQADFIWLNWNAPDGLIQANRNLTLRSISYNGITRGNLYFNDFNNIFLNGPARFSQPAYFAQGAYYDNPIEFAPSTGPKIDLYSYHYTLGIQDHTMYFRTNSDFAWFRGGLHSDTRSNPGSSGTLDMILKHGNLGIGTADPGARLEVAGNVKASAFIGDGSLLTGITASNTIINDSNTFVGTESGQNNQAAYNTFYGSRSGYANTTGGANTFIGWGSGYQNSTGQRNTFTGHFSGQGNNGSHNTFYGFRTGGRNNSGNANTYIGYQAGFENHTGSGNTYVGFTSGYAKQSGSNNTFYGYESGRNNIAGSGNVFIGYQAGRDETGSDKLYITNSNDDSPLIYGDFSTDLLTVNGVLDVVGEVQATKFIGDGSQLYNLPDPGEGIVHHANGNVGIGTVPDPNVNTSKLQVEGSLHVQTAWTIPSGPREGEHATVLHVTAGDNADPDSSNPIENQGRVFVGDSAYHMYQNLSPHLQRLKDDNFRLWVSKGIVTPRVHYLSAKDWADFVFKEDYDLMTLDELESFVRENGHLPHIPSAEDVMENGYGGHEMNLKQLQTIEELTLHLIDQHKQLQAAYRLIREQQEAFESLKADVHQLLINSKN